MSIEQIPWYNVETMRSWIKRGNPKERIKTATISRVGGYYNVKVEIVGGDKEGASGTYNKDSRTIRIIQAARTRITPTYAVFVFCHELAHVIQNDIIQQVYGEGAGIAFEALSHIMLYERTACALGYELYKEHYNGTQITREHFMGQYKETDEVYDWVLGYYEGIEDDIRGEG